MKSFQWGIGGQNHVWLFLWGKKIKQAKKHLGSLKIFFPFLGKRKKTCFIWVFVSFFSFSCEARLLLRNILHCNSRGERHKFHQCKKWLVLEDNIGYIFTYFLVIHGLSFLGGCIMLEKYFNENGFWCYRILIEEKCLQIHPLFCSIGWLTRVAFLKVGKIYEAANIEVQFACRAFICSRKYMSRTCFPSVFQNQMIILNILK